MNQQLKSEETQKKILEQAFQLFYRNGYGSTSVPEIVREVGLSKGAFYHHFKSKQEIGEQVVVHILRKRVYEAMIAPIKAAADQPVIPTLIQLFTDRINGFSEEEGRLGCPLNNLINELGCDEEAFRVRLRAIVDEWRTVLTQFLNKGIQEKELRADIHPSSTAIYLISAFEGARGISKLYNDNHILQEHLSGVIAYIQNLK